MEKEYFVINSGVPHSHTRNVYPQIISRFRIQPDHEVYEVKIEHKDKVMDYIWLNPTKDHETAINYEKTVFSKYNFLEETTKEFKATVFTFSKTCLLNNCFIVYC